MAEAVFFVCAGVSVLSVLAMILTRPPAYAALWLVLAFASLGGLFGLLGAPFAATVQVIIYAGAVMVLFLFVLMTVDARAGLPRARRRAALALAVVLGLVLLAELALAAKGLLLSPAAAAAAAVKPAEIGRLLVDRYLYAFEITSLLIMAALVGAIALVKRRDAA